MTVRLLTTEEVAVRFRTSPSTVRYWRHLGIGPAGVRVGRRVLYDEAECDRWWQSKVAEPLTGSGRSHRAEAHGGLAPWRAVA